jgi:hypothetical protein
MNPILLVTRCFAPEIKNKKVNEISNKKKKDEEEEGKELFGEK